MPCPTCGTEDVTPLTLTEFDDLAGAAKVCEECRTVFLIVDEARLPVALLDRQIAGWTAVRAVLYEVLDALVDHPVTREFLSRSDTETAVWRCSTLRAMERAVAALVPTLRGLAE